jgi:nucleotide-binding universal stress UspA family protein
VKILICSDGSEPAEHAAKLGETIAIACNAEVTLLGILEVAGASGPILDSLRRGQQTLQDNRISAEVVTKAGEPLTEIVRRTQETLYDLVVIGAPRREHRGLFRRPSKTYKIIKSVHPPVLAVMARTTSIRRILICTGGKKYIDNGVKLTGEIARGMGAAATLFHVMPLPPAIYGRLYGQEVDAAAVLSSRSELGRNLRNEKAVLDALGVASEVRLRQGQVLDEIFAEIKRGNYNLVVTGASLSHGSLHTYILGDVTREIVNRSECAVLVARAAGKSPTITLKLRRLLERLAHRRQAGNNPTPGSPVSRAIDHKAPIGHSAVSRCWRNSSPKAKSWTT